MSQLQTSMVRIPGPSHGVNSYLARPPTTEPRPAIILVHEIWGLVPHIKDVADRFAREGYVVLAPDLMGSDPDLAPYFTPENVDAVTQFMRTLAPGRTRDQTYIQQQLLKAPEDKRAVLGKWFDAILEGKLPNERFAAELVAVHQRLREQGYVIPTKIGSLGFCFGGTMSFKLACTGATQACVAFYGRNPDPIELVEKINCPVLGHYGGEDLGLNADLDKLVAAMTRYKKDFEMKIYPDAPHAFFNDTNQHTYRPVAAKEAWERSLRFLDAALR